MELGKINRFKVYEHAIRHCSDEGNRVGVEMFGRLIVELARTKKGEALKELEAILAKEPLTRVDKKNIIINQENIETYEGWIENYSPDATRYKERLSQADVNSWKQGGGRLVAFNLVAHKENFV